MPIILVLDHAANATILIEVLLSRIFNRNIDGIYMSALNQDNQIATLTSLDIVFLLQSISRHTYMSISGIGLFYYLLSIL
jgi:hypothetical protein